jgi:hypothetical protein
MRSRDTSREALDAQRTAWRRLGPTRRVELAFEMSEQAREISIRGALARVLAGSFASTYHGDPRTTNDIDLVIDPSREALESSVSSAPRLQTTAFDCRGQFNVVLLDSGWKARLILRKDRPFSRSEFERRQPTQIAGRRCEVPCGVRRRGGEEAGRSLRWGA